MLSIMCEHHTLVCTSSEIIHPVAATDHSNHVLSASPKRVRENCWREFSHDFVLSRRLWNISRQLSALLRRLTIAETPRCDAVASGLMPHVRDHASCSALPADCFIALFFHHHQQSSHRWRKAFIAALSLACFTFCSYRRLPAMNST